MLVPRIYGIGDLSHIITGHAYKQAKAIFDSMGSDLSCFVPTEAYRGAVRALQEHRFVILLGDPASGKSTIAAILALRKRLKQYLPAVAVNRQFLPETARRLGDPLFTEKLILSAGRLKELVEQPVEFLTEVLEQLDAPSQGAIALIFLNSETGVPSPIGQSPALEMVTRLLGVHPAEVAKAMEHLNDSLTRRQAAEDGDRWVFRHPTVTDAFAEIVARSPELIELYVHGAKVDRLVREVVCAPQVAQHAYVRIPTSLFATLMSRLQGRELDESFKAFLGVRAGSNFLSEVIAARPDILEWAATTTTTDLSVGSLNLLAALNSYGLLPESTRVKIVERLVSNAIDWMQTQVFSNAVYKQLFKDDEFTDLVNRFRNEWLSDLTSLHGRLQGQFSSDNELGLYEDFKDNIEKAEFFFFPDGITTELDAFYSEISSHIESLEEEEAPIESSWSSQATKSATISAASATEDSSTIFDDVDD